MAEARRAWAENAPRLDPARLVSLDETRATTNMTRSRGRAPHGERPVCPVPHGRWRTTTFLCALRADGLLAPLVLDGAVDGPAFLAWVEQVLAPALRPGDTVVADNLGSHRQFSFAEAVSRSSTLKVSRSQVGSMTAARRSQASPLPGVISKPL